MNEPDAFVYVGSLQKDMSQNVFIYEFALFQFLPYPLHSLHLQSIGFGMNESMTHPTLPKPLGMDGERERERMRDGLEKDPSAFWFI